MPLGSKIIVRPDSATGGAVRVFLLELEDRQGTFAHLAQQLADQGVNVLIYGFAVGGRGAASFVTSDEEQARRALDGAGVSVTEAPLVFARMQDRPGEAARVSRTLADAGVNLSAWLPVDTSGDSFTVAIGVDDEQRAQEALGDAATSWSYS